VNVTLTFGTSCLLANLCCSTSSLHFLMGSTFNTRNSHCRYYCSLQAGAEGTRWLAACSCCCDSPVSFYTEILEYCPRNNNAHGQKSLYTAVRGTMCPLTTVSACSMMYSLRTIIALWSCAHLYDIYPTLVHDVAMAQSCEQPSLVPKKCTSTMANCRCVAVAQEVRAGLASGRLLVRSPGSA